MAENWAIIIHGGADATPGRPYEHVEADMKRVVVLASEWLAGGMAAIDVAQKAVVELEVEPPLEPQLTSHATACRHARGTTTRPEPR